MMAKRIQVKLGKLISKLSSEAVESRYELAQKMFGGEITEEKPHCPYCGSEYVVKNGHKCHKQEYLCRKCQKTFVSTTNTLMANSHQPREIWEEVIDDTLSGHSLNQTAQRLGLTHDCTFHMRHKFLAALAELQSEQGFSLGDVSELDETFVLDSYKGAALPQQVDRKARKHGEKAEKRGISNEYVCICTGAQRGGGVMAKTINRAKPSSEEIQAVFSGHISENSLILCDGLKSYRSLEKIVGCSVRDVNSETEKKLYNLNTVNAFHSFIKSRYELYRGVATKYLNRYNALFAAAYKCTADRLCRITDLLLNVSQVNHFISSRRLNTVSLLSI